MNKLKINMIQGSNFLYIWQILFFVAVIFIFSDFAQAQATRTWVSGIGDDVNPCSRTAPCKTFAGAISKTAKGGEINCLDSGGFGSVTITKSITIDGTGTLAGILGASVQGVIINITDSTDSGVVRIRGLSINGAGSGITGIKIISANKVSIENTVIDGFIDGITATSTGTTIVLVKDSSIRNNSASGINAASAGSQIALSNVSVIFNATGLSTSSGGKIISFRNNVIFGNGTDGEPTSTVGLK